MEDKEEEVKATPVVFNPESFEFILDRVHVENNMKTQVYNLMQTFVMDNRIKTQVEFNTVVQAAKEHWERERGISLDANSTFRSACSVIRGALEYGIYMIDVTSGEYKGKTALSNEVKEAKAATTTDNTATEIKKCTARLLNLLANLDSTERDSVLDTLINTFTKAKKGS